MFAVTNVDDLVLLALYFGQAPARRVVLGQYLGFAAILLASVAGALGAGLLPDGVAPYLGLVPLALGLRAAWGLRRGREDAEPEHAGPSAWAIAGVTLANGGDNVGVYVPVFATAGTATLLVHVAVFLLLVGLWCAAGRFLATRPAAARATVRWGHVLLPVVLVAIGLAILIGGGAFGG